MAVLMAGLALWAFSLRSMLACCMPGRQGHSCFGFTVRPSPPGSLLFIAQSALVHVRKVRVHRTLGWVGAALAAIMVASGFVVSTVMLRFEMTVLHRKNVVPFLSVLWCDMILFGTCMSLAIYFRKRPEYHRLFPGHLPAHASDFRQI